MLFDNAMALKVRLNMRKVYMCELTWVEHSVRV